MLFLPGFIVLNGGLIPPGGLDCFNSGFLPAAYKASVFKPADLPVANIKPLDRDPARQRRKLDLVRALFSINDFQPYPLNGWVTLN